MKFGSVPIADAQGGVLAHSARLPGGVLRKGLRLGVADIKRLREAGFTTVVVAQLSATDVAEDVAAARMAEALAGEGVEISKASTGRVNLHARRAGLLQLDAARIHAANAVHEGLTIATLHPDEVVREGQMLATIKIIPYAVPEDSLDSVVGRLDGAQPAMEVAEWRGLSVGLVMTRAVDTRSSVLAKMRQSVIKRLDPLNASLALEQVVAHDEVALAAAFVQLLAAPNALDLVLVSGIAATVDRADVVPAAIIAAGGRVHHVGMPVDPGNLLVLAELPRADSPVPVIGVPTCARSLKLNGFDFVLRRFAAGLGVTPAHIVAMGVGGLLTEIESRPMPRGGK
jgi:molybdenum cofactor cytidylyltransferase